MSLLATMYDHTYHNVCHNLYSHLPHCMVILTTMYGNNLYSLTVERKWGKMPQNRLGHHSRIWIDTSSNRSNSTYISSTHNSFKKDGLNKQKNRSNTSNFKTQPCFEPCFLTTLPQRSPSTWKGQGKFPDFVYQNLPYQTIVNYLQIDGKFKHVPS